MYLYMYYIYCVLIRNKPRDSVHAGSKMNAQQRRQLEPLLLNAVRETGRELGRGAYGVVTEVIVSGTVCAAKKLHEVIVQVYDLLLLSLVCVVYLYRMIH